MHYHNLCTYACHGCIKLEYCIFFLNSCVTDCSLEENTERTESKLMKLFQMEEKEAISEIMFFSINYLKVALYCVIINYVSLVTMGIKICRLKNLAIE